MTRLTRLTKLDVLYLNIWTHDILTEESRQRNPQYNFPPNKSVLFCKCSLSERLRQQMKEIKLCPNENCKKEINKGDVHCQSCNECLTPGNDYCQKCVDQNKKVKTPNPHSDECPSFYTGKEEHCKCEVGKINREVEGKIETVYDEYLETYNEARKNLIKIHLETKTPITQMTVEEISEWIGQLEQTIRKGRIQLKSIYDYRTEIFEKADDETKAKVREIDKKYKVKEKEKTEKVKASTVKHRDKTIQSLMNTLGLNEEEAISFIANSKKK